MSLAAVAAVALLAACSSATRSNPPPPAVAAETPPATKDPGTPLDEKPLQESIPPPGGGAAGGASGEQGRARPDGAACLAADECASGICEGQGCTETRPGTCAPKQRACTRDLRQYCGCDGTTFGASGNCPGRRFASRTPCSTAM